MFWAGVQKSLLVITHCQCSKAIIIIMSILMQMLKD